MIYKEMKPFFPVKSEGEKYLDFLKVKFNSDEKLGTISIKDEPIFCAVCKDIKDLKFTFMNYISREFDISVSKNLGIGFPYIVGDMTFYSISEIEKYIEGTQSQRKE